VRHESGSGLRILEKMRPARCRVPMQWARPSQIVPRCGRRIMPEGRCRCRLRCWPLLGVLESNLQWNGRAKKATKDVLGPHEPNNKMETGLDRWTVDIGDISVEHTARTTADLFVLLKHVAVTPGGT